MKELLNMRNLTSTHYDSDSGDHVLEFSPCCTKYIVTVRGLGPVEDPYYWDDEDNFQRAIDAADVDDIDVYVIPTGGKAVKFVTVEGGISWEV